MSTSSFEEFAFEVPGYQFILDDAGKEVLVPVPEIFEKREDVVEDEDRLSGGGMFPE